MCNKKWIPYNPGWQSAQWLDWKKAPKHFPKPNLHQNKRSWSVWWSAASLIHYSFLNPSETITSEKLCSANLWDAPKAASLQLALVNRKGPILLCSNAWPHICTTKASKVEWIGLRSFASSVMFTWPFANWLPILPDLDNFLQSTTSRRQKMLSKSSSNPEAWIFFCYRNKPTYVSCAKMYWL